MPGIDRPAPDAADPGSDAATDASTAHLHARLAALEERVSDAVDRRRAGDPRPDDPFRGLYLSDEQARDLVDGSRRAWGPRPAGDLAGVAAIEAAADAGPSGGDLRLRLLAEAFGIDLIDTELLLVALAPDVDPRFEQLYGYLQDDVTRRRATIGLALELAGLGMADPAARRRLSPGGRLVDRTLLVLEDRERPFLGRTLRVPDRVTGFLLGDPALEPSVAGVLEPDLATDPRSASPALARALAAGTRLTYLRELAGSAAATTAISSVALVGSPWLALDAARVAQAADAGAVVGQALLEARLRFAVLVVGPVDALADRWPAALAALADSGWPVVLHGGRPWDPSWGRTLPLQLDAPVIHGVDRARLWRSALERRPEIPGNGHIASLVGATRAFHLTPTQIDRAVDSGLLLALAEDVELTARHLQAGARRQNTAGLERLARRIEPVAGWDDLVVPGDLSVQLGELSARARHRDRVLGEWQAGGRSSRGRGITALFAGESGTGKTLSAEVIARELGLDLYVIDLSTVVDKYIGETEKNLDRIFTEADKVNGVLLFDEADAIFGKRSEVRDARDRYANVEVAYLLQRMERFDGLAILTTNLRANLDESFTRRLDIIIDFPTPDATARRALWRMHLPDQLPQAGDLDLAFLAERFTLAGGNIRNVCLTAAFLAADADRPIGMDELIRATGREYRKLGRLTIEAEFGRYHELLTP